MSRSQGGFNEGCREGIWISDSILGEVEGEQPTVNNGMAC